MLKNHYIFGEWMDQTLDENAAKNIVSIAKRKQLSFSSIPINPILDLIERFSKGWVVGSENFETAIAQLKLNSAFSEKELRETLGLLPSILKADFLKRRLESDLGSAEMIDDFTSRRGFEVKVRAYPKGVTLHVTANNVFLSSIDSLLMGLTTKNVSLLKVGRDNFFFPLFFAQKLLEFDQEQLLSPYFCVLQWKGGAPEFEGVESVLKQSCDTIMLWGGEEMAKSYRSGLASHVNLIEYGPKISIQVISSPDFNSKDAAAIVKDVVRWEQKACSNAQILFFGERINVETSLELLEAEFKKEQERNPRPELDSEDLVELRKEAFVDYFQTSRRGKSKTIQPNLDYLLHYDERPGLRTSPLGRTLIIKKFSSFENLFEQISPWKYYLQTCGILIQDPSEAAVAKNYLSLAGIKRFTTLGKMTEGQEGAPHDGSFSLSRLVNFVADESFSLASAPVKENTAGYIFSSGGTTGNPKFIKYQQSEFDLVGVLLAKGFSAQGIKSHHRVANLFMAANLWSSYQAVDRALQFLGCEILGIGGQCPTQDALHYLQRFPVDALVGMPTQLIELARLAQTCDVKIKIPKIFYAGEMLTQAKRDFLTKIFSVDYFGSAGHASVDAGPIGYQCSHCGPNVHHLLDSQVILEIEDGQAFVQSRVRDASKLIRYPTGDRVRWVDGPPCPCGDSSPRYLLEGRIDQLIMIWSSRIPIKFFDESLKISGIDWSLAQDQIQISESASNSTSFDETMEWKIDYSLPIHDLVNLNKKLITNLYNLCDDLKLTVPQSEWEKRISIKIESNLGATFLRNPRTGKIPRVIDLRH
ncbi:MAG: acyl-CoA reductase [Bacteriovoracaceae bacterium]|nr:acyl-CoA reductase [Bacteriovoracaceae bacterium]